MTVIGNEAGVKIRYASDRFHGWIWDKFECLPYVLLNGTWNGRAGSAWNYNGQLGHEQEAAKRHISMPYGALDWRTPSLKLAAKELSVLAVAIQPNEAARSWLGLCIGLGRAMPLTRQSTESTLIRRHPTAGNGVAVRQMSDQELLWPRDLPTPEKPKVMEGAWWICIITKPVEKWVDISHVESICLMHVLSIL